MDPIQRMRRATWTMLVGFVFMMWALVTVATVVTYDRGMLNWWRVVPAAIVTLVLTWVLLRMLRAFLDRRHPTREVVVSAVLAVVAAVVGGAEPFGWGITIPTWLSIATLEIPRRRAVAMTAATFVVSTGLGALTLLTGTSAWTASGNPGKLVYIVAFNAFLCVLLPPSNRVVMWIWTLAVQAHEGRAAHARLAVAEERLRLARDLHDLVGHQLSAIAVKTELAVRLSDADAAAAKAEMSEVNTLTRKALKELRQAVRGYRELDLSAELNSVKGVLEAAGVRCEVRLPYRELPAGVAPVFAYVVREAATNVLKHSSASFCDVTIRFTDREAELRVRNDGVERRQTADLGSGLVGMSERLAAVGGTVTARPTGDGEFLVHAVVLLPIRG
ncbi:sensor histidine kinase [Nonomuraea purpurea]|uniref:Sensor histidine kinase n=1 Tax=Nonomuraea purpurea TaxID=1849276 RepID=A0ABV8GDA6_9ACTN